MDRVFANFQIDNDFYLIGFLFLLITMIISILIIVFISRIETLRGIIEQAKEVDKAKEERLSFLNSALNDEKILNVNLKERLKEFESIQEHFMVSKSILARLQNQIIEQEKEHLDELQKNKLTIDKLRVNNRVLTDEIEKLEESDFMVKKSYDELKERYKILYLENRELKMELSKYTKKKPTIQTTHIEEQNRLDSERFRKNIRFNPFY